MNGTGSAGSSSWMSSFDFPPTATTVIPELVGRTAEFCKGQTPPSPPDSIRIQ